MINANHISRIASGCLGALLLLHVSGCAFKGIPKCVSRKMQISAGAACPGCQQVECICEVDGRCAGYQATKWSFLDGCGHFPLDSSASGGAQTKEEIPAPKGTDAGEDEAPAPPTDGPPSIPKRPEDDAPGLLPDEPAVPRDEPFPQQPVPSDDNTPPLFPPDRPALPPARPDSDSPAEEPAPPDEPTTPEPELFPEDAPKPAPKAEPKPPAKPQTKPAPPSTEELFPDEPKKPKTAPKTDIDDLFKDDAPASKAKPKRPAPPKTDDLFPAEKSTSPANPGGNTKPSNSKSQPLRPSVTPRPTDQSNLIPNRTLPRGRYDGEPMTTMQTETSRAATTPIARSTATTAGVAETQTVVKVSHDEVRFVQATSGPSDLGHVENHPSDSEADLTSLDSGDSDDFGIEVP